MKVCVVFCFLHSVFSTPLPQTADSTSVSDWVGAITGLIAQVGESQQFQDGMTRAQEQVSDIQQNIPANLTSTLRDSFINIVQQQQENIPANITTTLRDSFLSIIQEQNMTENIPAVRSIIENNTRDLTLPQGVNLDTLLAALPAEEAATNLRSSVDANRDTINSGIQTVLDNIPENALENAGNILNNLFG